MGGHRGDQPATAGTAPRDRLGLALSGGGFRASFFHVGVLARLAELGMLRHVEVLSTVSGGSIVGAAYYLRVKNLLESKHDAQVRDSDYVELVRKLDEDFTKVVKTSIRTRALANPVKNLRMLVSPNYSRSERIGDLYDREFYKPIWKEATQDRVRRFRFGPELPIELRELLIHPAEVDAGERFRPDEANPGRRAKVPVLLLNATTLNTGHNWRFEAVRMGEPPPTDGVAAIVADIDKNRHLMQGWFDPRCDADRGVRHHDVGDANRQFPLGLAVAASAAVPGVFHPLSISGMYDGARVQLADGGVHDNQGVQGLLDSGCSHLIVSDASAQMADRAKVRPWAVSVLSRSSSIYGDRIRDEQLLHVRSRRLPMAFMHLRKGLERRSVEPGTSFDAARSVPAAVDATEFGVSREVQEALSRIRTDLDSFTDLEAMSLSLDGYLMSRWDPELNGDGSAFDPFRASTPTPPGGPWRFEAVEDRLARGGGAYLRHLRAGSRRFLRALWATSVGVMLRRIAVALLVLASVWFGLVETHGDWAFEKVVGGVLVLAVGLALLPAVWAWLSLAANWLMRRVGQVRSP